MQRNKAPGKHWKKFKGFFKNCGIQGHKVVNCTREKGSSEIRVQRETRKCYNCNKVGHLAKDCIKKSTDTAFVGCILTKKVPAINDKEKNETNEFDPIAKLSWINPIKLANQIEQEEGLKVVYFDQEVKMDKTSNLARGPKMTNIHEVNIITSHFEKEYYKTEEYFNEDDYSTDNGDYQYGEPDMEY
jgi:Zinc knuckle